MKKIEMHCHMMPISLCSRQTPEEAAKRYKACGYDGVVLTNHFSPFYMDRYNISYEQYVDEYIASYHDFERACNEVGLETYFGAEVTNFCPVFKPNVEKYGLEECKKHYGDYLMYGITEEMLRSAPVLFDLTLTQIRDFALKNGIVLVQAHPFRVEQGHSLKDIRLLDGLEINANLRFDPHEEEILALAREHNLIVTVGNDLHGRHHAINGAAFIPDDVTDSVGIANYLRSVKIPQYKLGLPDPTYNND